jgi:hypothetical protein
MSPVISTRRITRWVAMKLRSSFVHSHLTPIEHRSIQRGDSGLGFRRLRHLDKSYTAGLARVPVHEDRYGFDGTMCCKNFSQLLLCYRDIKVLDKNVCHEFILPLVFTNASQLVKRTELEKPISTDITFSHGIVLSERPYVLSLPAPLVPWSRRTERLGPPEGS